MDDEEEEGGEIGRELSLGQAALRCCSCPACLSDLI